MGRLRQIGAKHVADARQFNRPAERLARYAGKFLRRERSAVNGPQITIDPACLRERQGLNRCLSLADVPPKLCLLRSVKVGVGGKRSTLRFSPSRILRHWLRLTLGHPDPLPRNKDSAASSRGKVMSLQNLLYGENCGLGAGQSKNNWHAGPWDLFASSCQFMVSQSHRSGSSGPPGNRART